MMPVQAIRRLARLRAIHGVIGMLCLCLATAVTAQSSPSAAGSEFEDPFLQAVAVALSVYELDVVANLNDRDLVRQRIRRPRFGRFPDLPTGTLPGSEEIRVWESEYEAAQIGGLVILSNPDVEELGGLDD